MSDDLDRDLKARIDALPRSIVPPSHHQGRDPWNAIAARLEPRAKPKRARWIAVASIAVAAGVALFVGIRVHRADPSASLFPAPSISAIPSPIVREPAPAAPIPELIPEEKSYRAAIAALEISLSEVHDSLPQATAEAVDRDRVILAAAIDSTRAALVDAPDDPELRAALREAYEQEIDALSDVIDLCTRT